VLPRLALRRVNLHLGAGSDEPRAAGVRYVAEAATIRRLLLRAEGSHDQERDNAYAFGAKHSRGRAREDLLFIRGESPAVIARKTPNADSRTLAFNGRLLDRRGYHSACLATNPTVP
jgi:hypothetical protein